MNTVTDLLDKILTSTVRLLAIANWLLAVTYQLHTVVAVWFLGGVVIVAIVAIVKVITVTKERNMVTMQRAAAVTENGGANQRLASNANARQQQQQRSSTNPNNHNNNNARTERLGGFCRLLLPGVVAPKLPDLSSVRGTCSPFCDHWPSCVRAAPN
jgi:hypothetical protein